MGGKMKNIKLRGNASTCPECGYKDGSPVSFDFESESGSGRNILTIREYQEMIDRWVRTVGVRYFSELTNLGILMEETGEVARIMTRMFGEQSFKDQDKGLRLADELADVLFVVGCIANQTGIDLTEAIRKNMVKKNSRDSVRHRNNPKLTGKQG